MIATGSQCARTSSVSRRSRRESGEKSRPACCASAQTSSVSARIEPTPAIATTLAFTASALSNPASTRITDGRSARNDAGNLERSVTVMSSACGDAAASNETVRELVEQRASRK